jgi:hypothetical protein
MSNTYILIYRSQFVQKLSPKISIPQIKYVAHVRAMTIVSWPTTRRNIASSIDWLYDTGGEPSTRFIKA